MMTVLRELVGPNGKKVVGQRKSHKKFSSGRWQTWRTILLYNKFISILYMFRANTCSSSGVQLY